MSWELDADSRFSLPPAALMTPTSTAATFPITISGHSATDGEGDVDENFMLGMPFSDYHTMFENEVGMFFKDDTQFQAATYMYRF